MSANESVDADHDTLIVQFQAITNMEDLEQCRSVLENHDWNLESALSTVFASGDDSFSGLHREPTSNLGISGAGTYSRSNARSSRQDQNRAQSPQNGSIMSGLASLAANFQNTVDGSSASALQRDRIFGVISRNWRNQGIWSYLMFPILFPVQLSWDLLLYTWSLALMPLQLGNPLLQVTKLETEIERLYGNEHPGFFQGDFRTALEHSKSQLKLLLVFIHSPDHYKSDEFCRNVLCSPRFRNYVDSNLIFWAGSVKSAEGLEVGNFLNAASYPFLGLIMPLRNQMGLVARLEGVTNVEEAESKLRSAVDANSAELLVARAEREERLLAQRLREEQDAAYHESLKADREKERKKQEEIERARRAEQEEQARIEKEEQEAMVKKKQREIKKLNMPSEPEQSQQHVLISLQFPNGKRTTRRFRPSETVQLVYDFVDSLNTGIDNFTIKTRVPPAALSNLANTLEEAGLTKSVLLLVQDDDA